MELKLLEIFKGETRIRYEVEINGKPVSFIDKLKCEIRAERELCCLDFYFSLALVDESKIGLESIFELLSSMKVGDITFLTLPKSVSERIREGWFYSKLVKKCYRIDRELESALMQAKFEILVRFDQLIEHYDARTTNFGESA